MLVEARGASANDLLVAKMICAMPRLQAQTADRWLKSMSIAPDADQPLLALGTARRNGHSSRFGDRASRLVPAKIVRW